MHRAPATQVSAVQALPTAVVPAIGVHSPSIVVPLVPRWMGSHQPPLQVLVAKAVQGV